MPSKTGNALYLFNNYLFEEDKQSKAKLHCRCVRKKDTAFKARIVESSGSRETEVRDWSSLRVNKFP